MMEEFIDDIVSNDAPAKTEVEMAAEIQKSDAEKIDAEKSNAKKTDVKLGAAGAPEVAQDVKDTKVDTEENTSSDTDIAAESDDVKALATQLGWNEDHKGDDTVDAKTYILKSKDIQKSMSQHNKDLKEQLQVLNGSVSALKKHNESVYQAEVKKLTNEVAALKAERKAAIELADVAKVDELDKQIDEKQKDLDKPNPVDNQDTENPIYDKWVKDNQWYLEDDDMAKYADTVAQQYAGAPLDRVYKLVQAKVKEVFPEKFEKTKSVNNAKPAESAKTPVGPKSPVERSSTKIDESSFTKTDLSSDQLQIMKQFVQNGIMTEEQYIKDIAKMQ